MRTSELAKQIKPSEHSYLKETESAGRVAENPGSWKATPRLHLSLQERKIRDQIARLEEQLWQLSAAKAPGTDLQYLHDPATGRLDARKIATTMGVPLKRLSEALGLNYKAVHRSSSAPSAQPALRPIKRALELLHGFLGNSEAVRAWLNTPHPDLGGATALDTIWDGRADAVTLILENAWNGIPV